MPHSASPRAPATLDPGRGGPVDQLAGRGRTPTGRSGPPPLRSGAARLCPRPALRPISTPTRRRTAPLERLRVLDVGCGGGRVAEPLARLGDERHRVDPAAEHRGGQDPRRRRASRSPMGGATARSSSVEGAGSRHVVPRGGRARRVVTILGQPAAGEARGMMILSTLNRTLKAYALVISAANRSCGGCPRHPWIAPLRAGPTAPPACRTRNLPSPTPRACSASRFPMESRFGSDTMSTIATAVRGRP